MRERLVDEVRMPPPAAMTLTIMIACLLVGLHDTSGRADPEDFCARVRNDDRVRAYDPALRPGFIHAFKRVFPAIKGTQSDAALKARAVFRCMEGRLVACFAGPVSPCGKIDPSRGKAEADAFCRAHPQAADVPRDVTGQGAQFTFRCLSGGAEISGMAWTLDQRGFAKPLWTPLDSD